MTTCYTPTKCEIWNCEKWKCEMWKWILNSLACTKCESQSQRVKLKVVKCVVLLHPQSA